MAEEQNNVDGLMGPAQVATYLGVAERTVHLWAQQGKIPAFKAGSVWRFRRTEVDRWLDSTRTGPTVDDVEPLTPAIETPKSKWRIKKEEDQAEKALINACKAYIETSIEAVGREVFVVRQFEDRFGFEAVSEVLKQLKKEKKITEDEHEGLDGETVKIIRKRS